MSWLAALVESKRMVAASSPGGKDPVKGTASEQGSPASRPSDLPHSTHEIKQLQPITCVRCHRAPASDSRRFPGMCEACSEFLLTEEFELSRGREDGRR